MQTIRIFISSPGDVEEERDRARQVIEGLRRRYAGVFYLKPVLWEELPLQAAMSFQQGIDLVLSAAHGIDVAVFILWSRLGSPLGTMIRKEDGSEYRSGTEREFDLMMRARKQSGGARPAMLVYTRRDEMSFDERLRGRSTAEKEGFITQKKLVEQFIAEEFHENGSGHNVRAYHSFDRPVTFSQRLRAHLVELLDTMAGGGTTEHAWDIGKQGPPFLGLSAFQPQHADVFFGRELETLEARHALREQARKGSAFLLLSGASGSGKSSLARAGVLPAIVEYEVDDEVSRWLPLIVTPQELGTDPLAGLVEQLAADTILPELRSESDGLASLIKVMRDKPENAIELRVNEAFARAGKRLKGGVRVLLVLDQLEELFASAGVAPAERDAFLATVEALARCGRVWVLATVRSDFSLAVLSQPVLARMTEAGGLLPVLAPQTDALRRMIVEPARLAGLSYEKRGDEDLADRLLRDATGHAELLPLLEFVLEKLFQARTGQGVLRWEVYESLGGVEGALANRAEEVFKKLPASSQGALGRVLKALVTLGREGAEGETGGGGEQIVRRRATTAEVAAIPEAGPLLEAFVKERLLISTGDAGTGEARLTLAHESLMRVWPRAVQWADENREFLLTRARVASRMKEGSPLLEGDPLLEAAVRHVAADAEGFSAEELEFIEQCRDEVARKKARREMVRRVVTGALTVLTVLSLAAAGWAWVKQGEAEMATKEADLKRGEAAERLGFAESLSDSSRSLMLRELLLRTLDLRVEVRENDPKYGDNSNVRGAAQAEATSDLQTIEAVLSGEGQWHPRPPTHVHSAGARDGYIKVWRFGCCDRQVITENDPPSQLRQDGCKKIGLGNLKTKLISVSDGIWLRRQVKRNILDRAEFVASLPDEGSVLNPYRSERYIQQYEVRYLQELLALIHRQMAATPEAGLNRSREELKGLAEIGRLVAEELESFLKLTLVDGGATNHVWTRDAEAAADVLAEWNALYQQWSDFQKQSNPGDGRWTNSEKKP